MYNYPDSESDSDSVIEQDEMQIENDILEGLRTQFQNTDVFPDVEVDNECTIGIVRCAAHTLQLALQDASNNFITRNLLLECREVVRRLRTPQFVRIIREEKKQIPKLDCTTRWHSAIDMVESLIALKDICVQECLQLQTVSWSDLEDFARSLMPVKILTKKLQQEQLTVGDFYLEWLLCQIKLTIVETELATYICQQMKEREKILIENDTFINAIFLDPRVNSILSLDQQIKAKQNLTKLFLAHVELNHNDVDNSLVETTERPLESVEARAELQDYLNISYVDRHNDLTVLLRRSDSYETINNLHQSFILFCKEPLVKSTDSLLANWEKNKLNYPFLYELSKIVLATPMTQVSVERLFSSLKFLLNNYRRSMKDNIIDDLLFLRNNNIFGK